MKFHDLLADLPAPRDDEPPSLRDDIADELADHLTCAYRREVLKDGDETSAQQRVLDRFGDPKKLARRLWWQAMWSRIMGQRILSGLQWMLTLAAVILAGAVFRQQAELITEIRTAREVDAKNYQVISGVMQRLEQQSVVPTKASTPSVLAPGEPPGDSGVAGGGPPDDSPEGTFRATPSMGTTASRATLVLKPRSESDPAGPLLPNVEMQLYRSDGKPFKRTGNQTVMAPGAVWQPSNGEYYISDVSPDRYELRITLPDGQFGQLPVIVRDDEPQEISFLCPGERKKEPLLISLPPLPDDLRSRNCYVICDLREMPLKIGNGSWRPGPNGDEDVQLLIYFDAETGLPRQIDPTVFSTATSAEDRVAFLRRGPVTLSYHLISEQQELLTEWPTGPAPHLVVEIKPGEKQLAWELPEEFLAAARKKLVATATAMPNSPGGSPGAEAEAGENPSTFTVKLVEETEDGRPVTGASVTLERSGTKIEAHVIAEKIPAEDRLFRNSGKYGFKDLLPGSYDLNISVPNGHHCRQTIHIQPNEQSELAVACPKPREKTVVYLKAPPLPEDLRQAGAEFGVALAVGPTVLDDREWHPLPRPLVEAFFDPETGHLNEVNEREIRMGRDGELEKRLLTEVSNLDRHVELLTGPVVVTYFIGSASDDAAFDGVFWPHGPKDQAAMITIDAGVNHRELEIPQQLIAAARKQIAKTKPDSPDGLPGTQTESGDNAPPTNDEPAVLSVKLVQGKADGPPVLGAKAVLNWGPNYIEQREETHPFQPRYSKDGIPFAEAFVSVKGNVFRFPGLNPERYSLEITLLDGQTCKRQVLIRDDQPKELTIVCPAKREKAPVLFTAPPLPEDLREAKYKLWCRVTALPLELAGSAWRPADAERDASIAIFDPVTGKPLEIDGTTFDAGMPPEDRVAFLMTGPTRVRMKLYRDNEERTLMESEWPKVPGDEVIWTVMPKENRCELELSEAMLAAARKQLAAGKSGPKSAAPPRRLAGG